MSKKAVEFLARHGIEPEKMDVKAVCEDMVGHMRAGLDGNVRSMLMIPTYLSNDGAVPKGVSAAVIDAGGTNFRSALVSFTENGYEVSELQKVKMPGIGKPCTWEEFISFVADRIEPLMDRADTIGFCFSYSADITPDMDGRVYRIDKEVVVTGSEGQLIGASLIAELERRNIFGKRVVILNDTVAVLLGGASVLDKDAYSGFIGQVSGTGTNTCVSLPTRDIKKLNIDSGKGMIVNAESGLYNGLRGGDLDERLDSESNNPGSKQFEKLTAGVYLGEVSRLLLKDAAASGFVSKESAEKIMALDKIDTSFVDAWVNGERLDCVSGCEEDADFVQTVARAVLMRSARCMCANLLALGKLSGAGREKPICVCAEGSLVQKCRVYREALESFLAEYGESMDMRFELRVGEETTLPGAAAAALLNS